MNTKKTLLLVALFIVALSWVNAQEIVNEQEGFYDSFGTLYSDAFYKYIELNDSFEEGEAGEHYLGINLSYFWRRNNGMFRLFSEWGGGIFEAVAVEKSSITFTKEAFSIVDFDGFMLNVLFPQLSGNLVLGRLSDKIASEAREQENSYTNGDYIVAGRLYHDKGGFDRYTRNFRENRYYNARNIFEVTYAAATYVNTFRAHEDFSKAFIGDVGATNEYTVYIRISSADYSKKASRASIYSVNVKANGVPANVTFIPSTGAWTENNANDPQGRFITEISNGNSALYKAVLTMTNASDPVTNATLEVMVANDYVIQVSETESFESIYEVGRNASDIIARRAAFVDDYSNLGVVKYALGRQTSLHNAGVNVMFYLLGFNFMYKGNVLYTMNRVPSVVNGAPFVNRHSFASLHSLEMTGEVGGFLFEGDLYRVAPSYSPVFRPDPDTAYILVDDNDNGDDVAGADAGGESTGPEYPDGIDQDNNSVYDFQQAFIGLYAKPLFFLEGAEDRNNNDIPDEHEDDAHPDFSFAPDMYGGSLCVRYPFSLGYALLRYVNDTTIVGNRNAQKLEAMIFVKRLFREGIGFTFEGKLAKVNDSIPDYPLNEEDFQYLIDNVNLVKVAIPTTRTLYEDSVVFAMKGNFFTRFLNDFTFGVEAKWQNNAQLSLSNTIVKSGVLVDLAYARSFLRILEFTVKSRLIVMYQDDAEDNYANFDAFSTLENVGVTLGANFGESITLKGGYNFRYFNDAEESANEMIIHSLAMNYFIKGKSGRNDAFMYFTLDYNYYISVANAFENYNDLQFRIGFGSAH